MILKTYCRPRFDRIAVPALTLSVHSTRVALAAVGSEEPRTDSPPRPNVIIIMSDDMGFSDIGCYGSEIRTPTLDRLAAGGLRFNQFCNMGRCCPTRIPP